VFVVGMSGWIWGVVVGIVMIWVCEDVCGVGFGMRLIDVFEIEVWS